MVAAVVLLTSACAARIPSRAELEGVYTAADGAKVTLTTSGRCTVSHFPLRIAEQGAGGGDTRFSATGCEWKIGDASGQKVDSAGDPVVVLDLTDAATDGIVLEYVSGNLQVTIGDPDDGRAFVLHR